ncbi:MAG: Large-conductance mechanosensitive channel [candidate division TM6 bacterium GW2011_GWE2_42_60]|nr:MAG: Large-conductance mechanosensitive channel [candidate division TM6 bacterium GW2011_GWE2_42_60]HBY05832.1 hypothetical protein [Candidatus Dependentiae bacterium]
MRQVWRESQTGFHRLKDRFKTFALRGSIIDLAVGEMFMAIIYSLVAHILLPILSLTVFGFDLSTLTITLKDAVVSDNGNIVKEAITLQIGDFLRTIINFFLIALPCFVAAQIFLTSNGDNTPLNEEYKIPPSRQPQQNQDQNTVNNLPQTIITPQTPDSSQFNHPSQNTQFHKKKRHQEKSEEELLLEIRDLLRQLNKVKKAS